MTVPLYDPAAPVPSGIPGLRVASLPARSYDLRSVIRDWLSDPVWRERYGRLEPVYYGALLAPPAMLVDVLAALDGTRPDVVIVVRNLLAPLGLAVAEHFEVPLVIDLDDDDEGFFREVGAHEAADELGRLASVCLPEAVAVTVANPHHRAVVASRYGLGARVGVIPNSIQVPEDGQWMPPPRARRLLFVGNLCYQPNIDAVHWLVEEVAPLLGRPHRIDLVGNASPAVVALASDTVHVHGAVPVVAPMYAAADVVVVPLLSGSGTRIKVLEAFAQRRVVVSTTKGVEGIAAEDGRHLLVADGPDAFAAAIERALEGGNEPMVAAAHALVKRDYEIGMTAAGIAEVIRKATGKGTSARGDARRP
jgi:glycosyltransferase involved in cell wall biosynthesis